MKIEKWTFPLLCALWVVQVSAVKNTTIVVSRNKLAALNPSLTVCYGKLGCFSSGAPFQHPFFRPISLPPLPPELQKTTYFLYTRPNNDVAFVFSALQLELPLVSNFNPSKPTRILIHGVFDGVLLSTWMRDLKNRFLEMADENVILVDYGNRYPPMFWNSANARVVGAQIWQLIDFLHKNLGASPEGFHLIGHGLGAHIAGYAGERLHNLGRITGLDPGAAYFRNAPDIVKLNPTDALFVDVIHSSPGRTFLEGLGTIEDIGHVNFSPGRPSKCFPQKTLSNGATAIEVLQNTFFCRHFRSIEYFLFSFNQKGCFFVGAECSSSEEFYVGRCNCGDDGSKCRFMGQFATPAPYEKRYYLVLGNNRPYCLHQYQVKMHLELPHLQKIYGSLKVLAHLAVIGESNFQETLHFRVNLKERRQYQTFLLTSNEAVGKVRTAGALFQVLQKDYNITINIEALEIIYLFPVPKEEVSNLLCKESEQFSNIGKQVILTPNACHTLTDEENDISQEL
ncbi:inactive pancreatic lipase-related protein 1 [Trichonephila clavata]|uniref:Inactive pancreatic lipase-related protein 1 n=1 Tax=Trichonephila clavata TaxID=2740835 RepID=A0A8X6GHE1_TRICU|nr:inactive pancreatic lipase-related protein 1 [Trichonephila clavata]